MKKIKAKTVVIKRKEAESIIVFKTKRSTGLNEEKEEIRTKEKKLK